MEKEINEKIIKITGSANIQEQLKQDHDYILGISANCVDTLLKSNQDGTHNLIYKLRLLGEVTIDDKGKKIRGKAKGSFSQKWRWAVDQYGEDYDLFMGKMLANRDQIIEFVNKL